ncbi:MAG: hypothetical protein QM755_24685 [Luteolibacter sp.]
MTYTTHVPGDWSIGSSRKFGLRMWPGSSLRELDPVPEKGALRILCVTGYTGIPLWLLPVGWLGIWGWRMAKHPPVPDRVMESP